MLALSEIRGSSKIIRSMVFVLALYAAEVIACVPPPPAPGTPSSISVPSSNTGSTVTISWGASSGTVTKYHLQRRKDAGFWSTIYSGSNTTFDDYGLTAADYHYRVYACRTTSTGTSCSGARTSSEMQNSTPLPTPHVPSDYNALRKNTDGTTIVLTENTNGTPSIGDIELVWNGGSGTYTAQILTTTAGSWQSIAADIVQRDFNVDGAIDVLLKDIDPLIPAIPSLLDQVVFVNPYPAQDPLAVTAVDDDFQKFFTQISSWILDPDWFFQFISYNNFVGTEWVEECWFGWEAGLYQEEIGSFWGWGWHCDWVQYAYNYTVPIFDASLSLEALEFSVRVKNLFHPEGDLPSDVDTIAAVDILEGILGVETGSNVFAITGTTNPVWIPESRREIILGRLVLGGILRYPGILVFLPQSTVTEDEEAEAEAGEFGEQVAITQIDLAAQYNNWPPRALIGEGEGAGNAYLRVPREALLVGAYFYPNLTDPSWGAPFDINDTAELIAANAAWIRTLMYFESDIYDIGCYTLHASRGIAYLAERSAMGLYPARIPRRASDTLVTSSPPQCAGF